MSVPLRERLMGLFSVVVTPFGPDGAFAPEAFETILQWHLAQGSAGLVIAADNGEASLLSLEERRRMAEVAVRVAKGRVPVVMGAIGTHAFTAAETARMVAAGAEAGCDATLVAPAPYIHSGTRSEIVLRYREIHRAVPLPVIAYNNPRHFGVPVEGDTLQALVDEIELVGVKQSSRDFLAITNEIHRFADRVAMFMGCGYLLMPGLALGAAGIMSTGIDLLGPVGARVPDMARAGWTNETRALHRRIARLYAFLLATGTAPAPLKAALNSIGLPAGDPRLPAQPLAGEDLERLAALLGDLLQHRGERC